MSIADLINGAFELSGSIFVLLNILKLNKDKMVHGVSWVSVSFFTCWGWWNIYYYPSLGQWFSTIGGVLLAITNTYWTCQLLHYTCFPEGLDPKEAVLHDKILFGDDNVLRVQ